MKVILPQSNRRIFVRQIEKFKNHYQCKWRLTEFLRRILCGALAKASVSLMVRFWIVFSDWLKGVEYNRLLGWLYNGSRGRPEPTKGECELWEAPRPPRKTLSPQPAPEGEDQNVVDFYQKSEWMQPYFNRILGGNGTWDFDEEKGHWVTLGTYDGPDIGRTFEIRSNAAVVGKLSVIPEWSYPKYGPPWAELRLRLNYPIEAMPADDVHYLLSALADCAIGEGKDGKHSPRAEAEATKVMMKALWDDRGSGSNIVIDMRVEGSWTNYLLTVDHWKEKGIDPWNEYETRRDHR